jgi:hypothetical protein
MITIHYDVNDSAEITRLINHPRALSFTNSEYSISGDRTTAVSKDIVWKPIERCPLGFKVLLLTSNGIAVIGHYDGTANYVGWIPMPRKP